MFYRKLVEVYFLSFMLVSIVLPRNVLVKTIFGRYLLLQALCQSPNNKSAKSKHREILCGNIERKLCISKPNAYLCSFFRNVFISNNFTAVNAKFY